MLQLLLTIDSADMHFHRRGGQRRAGSWHRSMARSICSGRGRGHSRVWRAGAAAGDGLLTERDGSCAGGRWWRPRGSGRPAQWELTRPNTHHAREAVGAVAGGRWRQSCGSGGPALWGLMLLHKNPQKQYAQHTSVAGAFIAESFEGKTMPRNGCWGCSCQKSRNLRRMVRPVCGLIALSGLSISQSLGFKTAHPTSSGGAAAHHQPW